MKPIEDLLKEYFEDRARLIAKSAEWKGTPRNTIDMWRIDSILNRKHKYRRLFNV